MDSFVPLKSERILLTTIQAGRRYQKPPSFFYGRRSGGCKKPLRGIVYIGGSVMVDPDLFERGTLDGEVDHGSESKAKPLQPGYYRCLGCGWTGHVSRPVLPEDLCCPGCSTRAKVERVG